MKNPYNGKNPVFESLLESLRPKEVLKFETVYEQSSSDMNAEDVRKYVMMLLDNMQMNLVKQAINFPFSDSIKTKILSSFMDRMRKMTENASIDDLFKGMQEAWGEIKSLGEGSKYKDLISPIYDKVDEGIADLLKAYAALKEKSGDLLMDPSLLKFVNEKMKELEASVTQSLSTAKKALA